MTDDDEIADDLYGDDKIEDRRREAKELRSVLLAILFALTYGSGYFLALLVSAFNSPAWAHSVALGLSGVFIYLYVTARARR